MVAQHRPPSTASSSKPPHWIRAGCLEEGDSRKLSALIEKSHSSLLTCSDIDGNRHDNFNVSIDDLDEERIHCEIFLKPVDVELNDVVARAGRRMSRASLTVRQANGHPSFWKRTLVTAFRLPSRWREILTHSIRDVVRSLQRQVVCWL